VQLLDDIDLHSNNVQGQLRDKLQIHQKANHSVDVEQHCQSHFNICRLTYLDLRREDDE
jgi:hypothetical protein